MHCINHLQKRKNQRTLLLLNSMWYFYYYTCCLIVYVHTCMNAHLFGTIKNAWQQLPKHLSQIGIALTASKLNMQTMFSGSSVCGVSAVTSRSPGCQYRNIVSSHWYWALYFKKFHLPSMKGPLFGLVYMRLPSVNIAVRALGVAGISSHRLVSLWEGDEMLWTALYRNTTFAVVSLR